MRKHRKPTYKRHSHERFHNHLRNVAHVRDPDNVSSSTDDIEEQLRRQRLKKSLTYTNNENFPREETEELSNSNSSTKKKTLGKYTYDASRGAYFPSKFLQASEGRPKSDVSQTNVFTVIKSKSFTPPLISRYVQLLHGSVRRRRLVGQLAGKMVLDSLSVARLQDNNWDQMKLRLPSRMSTDCDCERVCTSPWSRCFGVIPSPVDKTLPNIFSVHGSPFKHGKALLRDGDVGCLETLERKTVFHMFNNDGHFKCGFELESEINDFSQLPHHPEKFFFAGNRGCCCITNDWTLESMSTPSFSRTNASSDILCVECDHSYTRPDLIFFGQRNGQIHVHDQRTSWKWNASAGILSNQRQRSAPVDSVFNMKAVFRHRPDQLLVRGRCSWSTFDLRVLGGYISGTGSPSLVHNVSFMTTSDDLSTGGKGMAVDPLQSTIIIPFWHKRDAAYKSGQICLKLWSLESGNFLGAKMLQYAALNERSVMNHKRQFSLDNLDLELCPTLSNAWLFSRLCTKGAEIDKAKMMSGACGLWLKIGHDNIQHVTFRGRLDS